MATYRISLVNEDFQASNEHDCADLEAAREQAILGATAIGSEQVVRGERLFVAEVTIDEAKDRLARFVVSVGWSPLKL